MTITLVFRTDAPIPSGLFSRFLTVRIQPNTLYLYDVARHSEWKTVLSTLQKEGVPINFQTLFFSEVASYDWSRPDPDWVAAILNPSEMLEAANPSTDYDPSFPPPCHGILNENVPVILDEWPNSHVIGVGERLVFSEQMARVLIQASGNITRDQDLIINGERLTTCRILEIDNTCRVLAAEVFHASGHCALCAMPYSPAIGMWFSCTNPQMDIACSFDQRGYGHFDLVHPLVVSIELSRMIQERFRGKGYVLEPIYRRDSETGRLIVELLDGFSSLQ